VPVVWLPSESARHREMGEERRLRIKVVPQNFEIIHREIPETALKRLGSRERNQLAGCMHAHNELAVMNRVLTFSLNPTAYADAADFSRQLGDSAHAVQMWCLLQNLVGKLFETWKMLNARFLSANPIEPAIAGLKPEHAAALAALKDYFSDGQQRTENALRTIRDKAALDKAAFHYDKLNLDEAMDNLAEHENSVYLATHPANDFYYVGSALVFRTVFAMIADKATDTSGLSHGERTNEGFRITLEDANRVNRNLHLVLFGLIQSLLESAIGASLTSLQQTRIPVIDAPDPDQVGIPTFISIG